MPMLSYHSKCRNFILESFQRPMRKFICPGRAGPDRFLGSTNKKSLCFQCASSLFLKVLIVSEITI